MSNYIQGHAIGVSSTENAANSTSETPVLKYNKITFFGGNDGVIIDKVFGTNDNITEETIRSIAANDGNMQWGKNTYLLCNFEDSLAGGNVPNIENPITNWMIFQINASTNKAIKIANIEVNTTQFYDYTALREKKYKYWLIGSNATETSSPLISKEVLCDYWGWFLIDPENNKVYAFNLNQSGGNITQNENIKTYSTNSKYDTYSRGKKDFVSGEISALVYESINDFQQSTQFVEDLREFILSDRTKYVKDGKGRIYKVFTSNFSESDYMVDQMLVPKIISFSFNQCGDV